MSTFIKLLDYYSLNVNLTYNGKEKYSTVFGGLLTLFSIVIVLINAWLIGNDIIKKEEPTVITSDEDLGYTYPNYTISYDNFFLGYFFSDHQNNPFEDETVLKVVPIYYTSKYDTNGTLVYEEEELGLISCSDYFTQNNIQFPMSSAVMEPLKCINNLNHSVGGFWTVDYVKYIYFSIYTCRNNTLKPHEKPCKPQEEIENTLTKLFFNIFYESVMVNAKNYTHPMKRIISEDWYVMQASLFKEIDYHFENYVVKTDTGVIFNSDMDVKSSLGFQKIRQDYKVIENDDDNDHNDNNLIFMFQFYISNKNKIYQRTYIKIQNIFANLGGIIQVTIIVTKFFFNFYVKKKFIIKIMNNLFDFDLKNKTNVFENNNTTSLNKLGNNNFKLDLKKNPRKNLRNYNSSYSHISHNYIQDVKSKEINIPMKYIKRTQNKKLKLKSCEIISTIFVQNLLDSVKHKKKIYYTIKH